MAYTNTLTPDQISDLLMSISNSLYQEMRTHKDCQHISNIKTAYDMAIDMDRYISYYILRHNKECVVS